MEATDVALEQPIEFVDAICVEKSIILADGCTSATLTTADGEALPVTFIVSQPLPGTEEDNNVPIEETITSDGCGITTEHNNDTIDIENTNEEPQTVYAVHFPSDTKHQSPDYLEMPDNDILCEEKSLVTSDNSLDNDLLDHQSEIDTVNSITRLEDFMDVVTTYKCKFCRFSCPWKSGLMSHIRCCHINEKKCIVTLKSDKEAKSAVSSSKNEKKDMPVPDENIDSIEKIEGVFGEGPPMDSEANAKVELDKICKSSESRSENGKSLFKDSSLERHIFLCGQCSDGFFSLEDCKKHMIDDHNLKLEQNNIKPVKKRGRPRTRQCADTSLQTSSSTENDSNIRENKRQSRPPKNLEEDYDYGVKKKTRRENINERNFRCNRNGCGHRFSSESNLHYHYSCHSDAGRTFMCPECREEFDHWRGLVMHLWKEHTIDVDLQACSDCSYKTYSFFKLDNHRKIHSEERAFICQTCGKGFKQISQLRNHLVIHLDRKNLPEKRWYSQQQCNTCDRKFSDTKCLRKHQQAVHNKIKPYICSYCGHLSARKAMLELHMRQHTGEKPFLCEHCDYRTGDHNSLRRHRMRHTGAKPYKCPHCPYACIQAISYKTHLRNKHPGMEGLFSCSLCTFKSVSKENYINHMSDHKREVESLTDEAANLPAPDAELPLEPVSTDQSSVQMQLTDNALQQLEGILPGNITAAQLIYSCLNALSQDGGTVNLPPGVTVNIPPSTSTSSDGTQTITIQLPSSQEMENEPYYFTIQQQDGTTTALVLPSAEQNDVNIQETADLENVQFTEQDVSNSASLDCSVLNDEDESGQLHSGNSDSLVIAHIESLDDHENFSAEVITGSDDPHQNP